MKRERLFGYDLLKVIAMFMVPSLHFFLYSGYYDQQVTSTGMIFYQPVRLLFYQCVPLFLMLSGALNSQAKLEKKHYIKITPIIINSLIVAGVVILYKIFYCKESYPLIVWLQSVWSFSQPGYGWYVNLYISLFIVMPFLNLAYNALDSQKKKLAEVLLIVFVTTFAHSVNIIPTKAIGIDSIGFVPNYFGGAWPIAYYFVGMYINEFRPKVNKFICVAVVIISLIAQGLIAYSTTNDIYYSGVNFNNEDIVALFTSTFIFLTFYDIQVKSEKVKKVFAYLSSLSLTFYLISFIGDNYFYQVMFAGQFTSSKVYPLMFLKIIPLHLLCCTIASAIIKIPVKYISKWIMNLLFKITDRKKETEVISEVSEA